MFRKHLRWVASSQVWLLFLCACTPPTTEELLSQAEEAIAAGETRTAEIHLRNLLDREPNHVPALVSLGGVLLAAGKASAAEQNLRRALELGGDASVVHVPLLRALLMQKKFADVLALTAKPPRLQVPDQLNSLRIQAAAYRGLGARVLAEEAYREAIAVDPRSAQARSELAALLLESGRSTEASTLITDVLADDANFVPALTLRGSIALAQKDFRAAATSFSKAFAREPSAALAMYSYAAAKSAGLEEPEADLIAWNAANPQDAIVNFQLGSIALANGNTNDAIARYEAVLVANPTHVATLNNLAWLYGEQGDDRALHLAETAHALVPDNPAISDTLGWLHVRRGDATRGLVLLEHAITGLPHDPDVRYHWAVALTETGNPQRALEILLDLLATAGDFSKRGEAEELVAELQNRHTP